MSMRNIYAGPMPDDIKEVLDTGSIGFTVSSNFARLHASTVALAASNGWISTVSRGGRGFSSYWQTTSAGLTMLEHGLEQTPPLRR